MSTTVRTDDHGAYFQAIKAGLSHYIDFTVAPSQSLTFNDEILAADGSISQYRTTLLCVFATEDCWITVGANPVAVPGGTTKGASFFLPGGIKDFIGVEPGQKLSVVRDTADGRLHIIECL